MDGNKDEALKCLQIAKDSVESGNKTRALKFLNKARRLDPSIQIDDLFSKINSHYSNSDEEKPFDPLKDSEKVPRRRVSATGKSYTEEQVTVVKEIKRKKDYYEILGLEKTCSVEDLRKAYRKLSLKVHPDKNNAPGAEEAFKVVSKAFQCLSNEENRKKYDLVGSDEPVYETPGAHRRNHGGGMQGFNGADFDAEEIFRNFFFGGMHPATTTQFRGFSFGGDRGGSNGGVVMTLISLLPVLLILLVNFLPSNQPLYQLSKSYPYLYRFTTQKGVNFYVKAGNFEQEYPPGSPVRVEFEQRVEYDYHSIVSHNCRLERQQLVWGYRRETPNCDALQRFVAAA